MCRIGQFPSPKEQPRKLTPTVISMGIAGGARHVVADGASAADWPLRLGGGLGGTCGGAAARVVPVRDGRRRCGPGAARHGGVGGAGSGGSVAAAGMG